jgi:hypothetical protein
VVCTPHQILLRLPYQEGDEMSGIYGMYDKERNAFSDMGEKPYGKRTLGIPGLSWVIKIDLT